MIRWTLVVLFAIGVSAAAQEGEAERARRIAAETAAGVAAQLQAIELKERANVQWHANAPMKMEKATYCGLATSECPAVLSAQLKLADGFGLVVDFVEPKSPAEAAGLKQHDLLQKINDQVLVNPEQLRALVRMKKPSDDAKFTLLRQGRVMTVNVELGQREMPVEAENIQPVPGRMVMPIEGGMAFAEAGLGGAGGMLVANVNGRQQGNWSDGEMTLSLELKDGKAAHVLAKDRAGKEIFKGPVETDEQRKGLPPEIAAKLKQAENAMQPNVNVMWERAIGAPVHAAPVMGVNRDDRPRIVSSTDKDTLLLVRLEKNKPTWVFAFSTADGKTLFEGPVASDNQRKTLPAAIETQLQTVEKNLTAASEFGAISR